MVLISAMFLFAAWIFQKTKTVIRNQRRRSCSHEQSINQDLLLRQMFPSLAARETDVVETNFAYWKQKLFLLP